MRRGMILRNSLDIEKEKIQNGFKSIKTTLMFSTYFR